MNRVGIITHYYDSLNFGGVLQAYALCKILKEHGMEPEQICFPLSGIPLPWKAASSGNKITRSLKEGEFLRKISHRTKRNLEKAAVKLFIPNLASQRKAKFSYFTEQLIPHSAQHYDTYSVAQSKELYDIFVTGSDQVWNLRWYNPAYFLEFAGEKPKFSYGASMAIKELSDQEQALFKKHLADFKGISVREAQASDLLEGIMNREVQWVLDPTLLLTGAQWDEVCAPKPVQERYLFCYFLGKASGARKLARKFAKKHGLKIVTIPHLDGSFVPSDVCFGDIRMESPSPQEFLSLVKHSEYVFTDSFHATVFSEIYGREYFVFPRHGSKGMDDRIYSLTGLLGSTQRFCDTKEKKQMDYLCGCQPLTHCKTVQMEEMERCSQQYIQTCLDTAKEWIKRNET